VLDINGGELIVLVVVAAVVIGPQRLPGYAEQLAHLVRRARAWITEARTRLDQETGDLGVDWEALDPRKYDPRRIVRDALLEDTDHARRTAPAPSGTMSAVGAGAGAGSGSAAPTASSWPPGGPPPYDDEAT